MNEPRYVTHESEGRYTMLGASKRNGITVTVHDTLVNYRVVGSFRSETQAGTWQERRLRARRKARKLAEQLNEESA